MQNPHALKKYFVNISRVEKNFVFYDAENIYVAPTFQSTWV